MIKKLLFFIFRFINKVLGNKGLWELPFVPQLYEIFYKYTTSDEIKEIKYDNLSILGHARDSGPFRTLLFNSHHFHDSLNLFKKLTKNTQIVLDIGANIGIYSLLAAKYANQNCRIYAFEPDDKNYNALVKNIDNNNLKNIFPFKVAVSDKKGELKLYRDKYNLGSHSLFKSNVPNLNDSISVKSIDLDNFYEEHIKDGNIDLIKLDVQGAENLVLKGASKLFDNKLIKKIYTEYWPEGIKNSSNQDDIINTLKNYGFNIDIIEKDGSLTPIDKKELKPKGQYDLLCSLKK